MTPPTLETPAKFKHPVEGPVCQSFAVELPMDPPSVTHQAKKLGMHRNKAGRSYPTMYDSDDLKHAREAYYVLLLASGRRPRAPLAAPIYLDITYVFKGDCVAWYVQKPDLDNLNKTLIDALVEARFIGDDKGVVGGPTWKLAGPRPFIRIVGVSLLAPPTDIHNCPLEELHRAVRRLA